MDLRAMKAAVNNRMMRVRNQMGKKMELYFYSKTFLKYFKRNIAF